MTTADIDRDLVDMMDAVFAGYRQTATEVSEVELDRGFWQQLDELGLTRLTGTEESGGSGAGWYEACRLLTAAARHGVRIPLAEHDLLACWTLHEAGLPVDGAVRTVCVLDGDGTARAVPWAASVDRIVTIYECDGGYRVADLDAAAATISRGTNNIGEPRDAVFVDISALDGVTIRPDLVSTLRMKSALVRAVQTCAVLDRILEMSVEHVNARIQFGRPLARIQAVQHLIADIAAEAGLARAATEAALDAAVVSSWQAPDLHFSVAVARSCTGHAASVVVRNAHQVHGAIGTTREHTLHEFTRAALAWRSEFGSVRYWDEEVTRSALEVGGSGLWTLIAG